MPKHPSTTHGMTQTRFYHKWQGMRRRCYMETDKDFSRYGGKGIKIEWKDFVSFKKDMYKSYLAHVKKFGARDTTIERKDSEKSYSKPNCRWATVFEQNRNRRCARWLTFKGKTRSIADWASLLKIKQETIVSRIWRGWPIEKILSKKIFNRWGKPL